MKKATLFILLLFACIPLVAQDYYEENATDEEKYEAPEEEPNISFTVGFLQGGGSLIGGDLEFLVSRRLGLQLGAGFKGYGAGLNFHLKPSIRSSFVSLAYWHQGIGDTYAQSLLGSTFVYRSKKWFTAQIGLGIPLEKGIAWPADMEQPPVMLMYSIGAYFPLN